MARPPPPCMLGWPLAAPLARSSKNSMPRLASDNLAGTESVLPPPIKKPLVVHCATRMSPSTNLGIPRLPEGSALDPSQVRAADAMDSMQRVPPMGQPGPPSARAMAVLPAEPALEVNTAEPKPLATEPEK